MRVHAYLKVISAALLTITISTTTYAQTPIWGLQPGDSFRVQTIVDRQNTIQLGEAKESVQNNIDTITFEYRVLRILPGGNVSIQIRVVQAERKIDNDSEQTSTRQLPALNKISVIATVDPDGVIQELAEYDSAINRLLETHQSGRQLMDQSVSQQVFISWISYPFWLPAPEANEEADEGAKTQHRHDISLGLLGQLRTTVTCQTGPPGQQFAKATISGESRHVPPTTVGRKPTDTRVVFTNVTAQIDFFGGQGTIAVPTTKGSGITNLVDEPDTAAKRPPFEQLTLNVACSGEATFTIADNQRPLRFQQRQNVSVTLLPGYRIGQRSRYPLFLQP